MKAVLSTWRAPFTKSFNLNDLAAIVWKVPDVEFILSELQAIVKRFMENCAFFL
jgi:hypothetical protein